MMALLTVNVHNKVRMSYYRVILSSLNDGILTVQVTMDYEAF